MKSAPYPIDTRAKGWRLELDYERIRQSDTWALTPAAYRPWLLMLWMVAWEQTPCGSLPDDDELIAARLEMPPEMFEAAKRYLLRGWWKAEDGRLYHPVLTEHVLEMLSVKDKARARKDAWKTRQNAGKGDENNAERVPDAPERGGDDTGTGTRTSNTSSPGGEDKRGSRRSASKVSKIWLSVEQMCAGNPDLSPPVAEQYLAHRRAKRAPLTELAWSSIVEEVRKTQRPLDAALPYAMNRGWTGFEYAWVVEDARTRRAGSPSAADRRSDLNAKLDAVIVAASDPIHAGDGHASDSDTGLPSDVIDGAAHVVG